MITILQIGCFDGNDDVYKFVLQNSSIIDRLILVEPLLPKLEEAKVRYSGFRGVEFFNIAIVPDLTIPNITLYHPTDLKHAQLTSFNKQNVQKFFPDDQISEFTIPAKTINQFIEELQISKIDRLYIDTEGLDCKIILSLNLQKYDISYIEYEYIHCDGVDTYGSTGLNVESLLLSLGYDKSINPPFNMIFKK